MPGGPCAASATSPECVALIERLATQAPEKLEALAAQVPESSTVVGILKANAPIVVERLDAALGRIGGWVETSEVFATEQVPLLVKEIIYWGIASGGLAVLLGILFLFASWIAYRVGVKNYSVWDKSPKERHGVFMVMVWVAGVVGVVVGTITVCANIMDFIKPIVAPRLFLIEYFQQLVR